jgi:hypothetical protein
MFLNLSTGLIGMSISGSGNTIDKINLSLFQAQELCQKGNVFDEKITS